MLLVYKSNRLENLAGALSDVLREPLPWAGTPEWVGVQTQGVGVWLGMEISRRLGVWSNVYAPYPRAMIEKIFSLVLGASCPDTTRFEPGRLTWSVMGLLPEMIDQPEFSPLKSYLAGDKRGLKRYQLSRRIAETFDRYAVYRPDMVLAWESDRMTIGEEISSENRWQPVLWRALVNRHGQAHVAGAAKKCLEVLRKSMACPDGLPPRISIFGVSTLPPLYVNLLSGLPECVSVHLFLLSPSREHWAYIRSRRVIIRELVSGGADGDSLEDVLCLEEGNQLLSSMGRLGRDFQGVLEGSADYQEPEEDLYAEPGEDRLLRMIQADMLNLRLRSAGGEDAPLPVAAADDSLQVHVCHSPMREVQVLFDRLMGVFQDNLEIFPHDVIVMMPDIDTYGPFVEAVFGAGGHHVAGGIPYTVSDRGMAEESPVIRAFMGILRLAESRLPVQEVLDLLAMDPVREKFDLTEEEVGRVRTWVLDAGVRWGLDEEHRRAVGQPGFHENTWRFGLERLFLGIAMPDEPPALFQGALPYPGIEGTRSEILGKAADFFFELFGRVDDLKQPRPATEWRRLLRKVLSRLITADGSAEYQHRMVREALERLGEDSEGAGFGERIELPVVIQWLTEQFKQRPGVHGFLSGGVTFCNLLPMRSIPFKVICLLGMNGTDFPRSIPPSGFDLIAARPHAGDRSVRNDDRYLFLEALVSAREKLLIFYVGRAVSDNSVMPPSVVVEELLDAVDEGYIPGEDLAGAGWATLRERLVTEHPLQPFHPSCFDPGDLPRFSFSREHLAGARAMGMPRLEVPAFLTEALPGREDAPLQVSIKDLIRFFSMPADYFLRKRLGVFLQDRVPDAAEREPLAFGGLERFGAGEFLLAQKIQGGASEDLYPIMKGQGMFPLGAPGECAWEDLDHEVADLAREVGRASLECRRLDPLRVDMEAAGVRVTGKIDAVCWREGAMGRLVATYGKLNERRKTGLWIVHVLMNCRAVSPNPNVSMLIGRGGKGPETYVLGPLTDADGLLQDLLAVYAAGMRAPLPLFPAASYAYAGVWQDALESERAGLALSAASKKFFAGYKEMPAEADHPAIGRAFGTPNPLLSAGELGFSSLSLRVFGPMIRAEAAGAEILEKGGAA